MIKDLMFVSAESQIKNRMGVELKEDVKNDG